MENEHLQSHRGWTLVRDKDKLTDVETEHLAECDRCRAWLIGFTEMARRAGFEIGFEIPRKRKRNGTDG